MTLSSTPSAPKTSRSPFPAMALMELRIGFRSTAFRIVAILLFLLGWSVGGEDGRGVGMSAYAVGETACRYLGFAVAIWMSLGAVRDSRLHTEVIVFTKPQPPERLVLARFVGYFGQVLVALAILFLGAFLNRLFAGGAVLGASAYLLQYVRAAGVLFLAASASYCLASLSDSPVAGALIALYWVVALAGSEFLAKAYFPWYTQNLPAFFFLSLSLLCLTLWFYRRRWRGGAKPPVLVRVGAPTAFALFVWLLWTVIRDGHDPMTRQNRILTRIEMQTVSVGLRVPGFLLPDQNGKPTGHSDFPGRILLIALWSPQDPDSALLLARLEEIYQQFGSRGLLPIAICLSEDASAPATFARGARVGYPILYDWGTHNGARDAEASPLASAYRAVLMPHLILTDRRHRALRVLDASSIQSGSNIERVLEEQLAAEPE